MQSTQIQSFGSVDTIDTNIEQPGISQCIFVRKLAWLLGSDSSYVKLPRILNAVGPRITILEMQPVWKEAKRIVTYI